MAGVVAVMGEQQLELEEEEEQLEQDEEDEEVVGVGVESVNNNNHTTAAGKAARLPRWTKQEILVLIQGKRVAENRVRRGRLSSSSSSCVEPKWATVSSYCKRHGVNRGAVQCRKRWSNLAGDFKKIKEWESQIMSKDDSFWFMRNDIRRERKLPGFFEREVYDILDDKKEPPTPTPTPPLLLFDSGRTAPPDDALFSDVPSAIPIPAPTPISAKQQYQPFPPNATPTPTAVAVDDEKQAAQVMGSASRKRKRLVSSVEEEEEEDDDDATLLQNELIKVMEKNGKMLSSQMEAHNINMKLDRQDRKDHATTLVAVLNKLADALSVIADKL